MEADNLQKVHPKRMVCRFHPKIPHPENRQPTSHTDLTMSKIIVGIHGLGNKVPETVLKLWWESAIIEGLNRANTSVSDFDFELAYWAHLLHAVPLDPIIDNKKHHLYVNDPYIPATGSYQEEKSSDLRRKLMDYLSDQLDRIFLNDDLSINFSSISDFIVHHFFTDLEAYYTADDIAKQTAGDSVREQICGHLAELLRKHRHRKILLIAHSMGSIIAYDVLTRYVPDVEIDTLITIGSPLGLPIIRSRIGAEMTDASGKAPVLKTPENIRTRWLNMADLRDKIALFYNLEDDFKANDAGVTVSDQAVFNNYTYKGEKNPHKAFGYLRTPQMADVIHAFISQREPSPLERMQHFLMNQARYWWNRLRK